jgi:hypothetical protein
MVGEAEVIVGAEIDRFARAFRAADADPPALRPGQQALALEQARRLDLVEGCADVVEKGIGHGRSSRLDDGEHSSATMALKSAGEPRYWFKVIKIS